MMLRYIQCFSTLVPIEAPLIMKQPSSSWSLVVWEIADKVINEANKLQLEPRGMGDCRQGHPDS